MILFANSWLEDSVDHLKSEALARGVIRNAAVALAEDHRGDGLMFWIEAAWNGAGVLNVTKGFHQRIGDVLHLTMCLYIGGSGQGSLRYTNTNFATDFHLYAAILNPLASPEEYQLQPTRLTYRTAGHRPEDGGWTIVAIHNARVLTNSLGQRK